MDDRDLFFSEVCDGKLEREPFTIDLPQGSVTVYAEEIVAAAWVDWQNDTRKAGGDPDDDSAVDLKSMARLIVRCVVRENGKMFFKPEDVDRLAKGRLRYVEPLYQLCLKVNRIGSYATLKKKSGNAPPSSGCSPSVGTSDCGTTSG